ncbi:MAG: trypsin-like peptidase domain-containing protein, partial [Candidatus Omnitrophica bacterium]|nr:trypsin-like peptidase domain-containing protein [Candidatus Omnitrophota bacterium]
VIYPEGEVGKAFWAKVYAEAQKRYGSADVPVDTFNKVWIVPEKAVVYETRDSAYVVESKLKVMLEQDYLALEKSGAAQPEGSNKLGSAIVREVVIPVLEKEVNEGKNFAQLRQVYHSLILAVWYKDKVKESIFGKAYVDQKKTGGVDIEDKAEKEKIWAQYVEAFKKGAYNYINEDYDPATEEIVTRKYFSGGFGFDKIRDAAQMTNDPAQLPKGISEHALVVHTKLDASMTGDAGMLPQSDEKVSIFSIRVNQKDGESRGTAFIVGEDEANYYLLTNYHVLRPDRKGRNGRASDILRRFKFKDKIRIGPSPRSGAWLLEEGHYVAADPENDIALVKLSKTSDQSFQKAVFTTVPVTLDRRVGLKIYGYNTHGNPVIAETSLGAFGEHINFDVTNGWSGGPVLDEQNGAFYAMLQGSLERHQGLSVDLRQAVIPGHIIRSFLEKHRVPGIKEDPVESGDADNQNTLSSSGAPTASILGLEDWRRQGTGATTEWDVAVTDPRLHTEASWTYIVHGIQDEFYHSETRGDVIRAAIQAGEEIDPSRNINLLYEPERISEYSRISASYISFTNTETWGEVGFILSVPSENIFATSPQDVGAPIWKGKAWVRKQLKNRNLMTPERLLALTRPGQYNELEIAGQHPDDPGKKLGIAGVFLKVSPKGRPVASRGLVEPILRAANKLGVPVVHLSNGPKEKDSLPQVKITGESGIPQRTKYVIEYVRDGNKYRIISDGENPLFAAVFDEGYFFRPMTLEEFNEAARYCLFNSSGDPGAPLGRAYAKIFGEDIMESNRILVNAASEKFREREASKLNRQSPGGDTGGIDLTRKKIGLEVQNEGQGVEFKIDPTMIEQLQNASGLTPVIIDIRPMTTTVPMFLGLSEEAPKMVAVR